MCALHWKLPPAAASDSSVVSLWVLLRCAVPCGQVKVFDTDTGEEIHDVGAHQARKRAELVRAARPQSVLQRGSVAQRRFRRSVAACPTSAQNAPLSPAVAVAHRRRQRRCLGHGVATSRPASTAYARLRLRARARAAPAAADRDGAQARRKNKPAAGAATKLSAHQPTNRWCGVGSRPPRRRRGSGLGVCPPRRMRAGGQTLQTASVSRHSAWRASSVA